MQIDISKEQYKDLITMCALANSMFGILGEEMPNTEYKEKSKKMEKIEKDLLKYANDFDCPELVEGGDGECHLHDEFYEEYISPIISDYNDNITFTNLANKLAWRDFHLDHSKKDIEKMVKENGGYFGVALYDYEKKYWDEFEENGVERLVVGE